MRSKITVRGEKVSIEGPPEEEEPLRQIFRDMESMARRDRTENLDIDTALALAGFTPVGTNNAKHLEGLTVFEKNGFCIRTRSRNQKEYIRAAHESELVFVEGPAGTGKTYLAVALAVSAFNADDVERIILVRPAVEAGENLGFLPGDLREKVEPYFRPIYDALMEMIPSDRLKRYIDQNRIEIAPLAYMRGRTLSNAFVILDEAQNTTSDQLKMFLTRLGSGSRAIVTGDLTQVDIPDKQKSGLSEALIILRGIKGIQFVTLDHKDVVRHSLVKEIILAYEKE
ncbi:MAG: PhoH family protein [Candidatus Electryonea clarkiae]|nr:PhoH family protein [Candidatus Electryonea clarkiae]MDP8289153.1 PhoH family protein [Candidatus Electryonea clarkiae]